VTVLTTDILLALLEGAQVGLGVIDDEHRYLYANDRLAELNGVPAEAHAGRTIEEILPALAPVIHGLVSQALSTGRPVVSASLAGSTAAFEAGAWDVSYVPIQLDDRAGVGVLVLDVTDRERAVAETRRRLSQQAALADLGQLALASSDRTAVLDAATAMLVREMGADFAGALQFASARDQLVMCAGTGFPDGAVGALAAAIGPGSMAGYTLSREDVVVTPDTADERRFTFTQGLVDLGVRSAISTPIPGPDGPFGVLGVLAKRTAAFGADDASTLRATANVLGALVVRVEQESQLAGLAAQRGRLVAQALDTGEREQRQVADLLYDDVLQHLLFARMELASLDAEPEAKARVQASLDEATGLIRNVAGGLHSTTLSHAGLAAALEGLCDRLQRHSGLRTELVVEASSVGIADDLVHSIVSELLTNVVRHAGADVARVTVSAAAERLEIVVADDGRGMTPAQFDAVLLGETVGLANVRERITALGGAVEVGPGIAGRGTAVHLTIPR
jgi:signal transduction histidine kinase